MADAAGEWDPASVAEVSAWFSSAGSPWWIAGGYAIELVYGDHPWVARLSE
jgi:hypothetical protein